MSTTYSQELVHTAKTEESGISLSEKFKLNIVRDVSLETISSNPKLRHAIDRVAKRLDKMENLPVPTTPKYQSILPKFIGSTENFSFFGGFLGFFGSMTGGGLMVNESVSILYETDSLALAVANWTEPTIIPSLIMGLSLLPVWLAIPMRILIFNNEYDEIAFLRGKPTGVFYRVCKKLLLAKRGRSALSHNESMKTKFSLEMEEYCQKIIKEKSKMIKDIEIVNQYMTRGAFEISQGDLQIMNFKSITA